MSAFRPNFEGKTVLVTGAGKGVGRAVVTQLHENGAIVYAVSRTKSDLDSLQQECPNIIPVVADIADWDNTRETLTNVLPEQVDVLINNAGVGFSEPFMKVTSSSFNSIIDVNIKAIVNISQICASKMIDSKKGGTIVNISSMYALRPSPTAPVYSASKAAVDSLTKTMAIELGPHKINVVAMNLGYMDTHMLNSAMPSPEYKEHFLNAVRKNFPLGEVFVPMDQIVNSILFVSSGMVGMMTGNGFVLDGGYCAS